ncbi:hypothetical protein [Aureitalea marina]|uniref:Lysoplasmalogenase n=1 Tax=Aureitalea marina TaxID=930804 RepID=A0A2S7KNJ1_9FLAO|nr:hypothetical protein [Aureitalea marina]PQB04158.1 hypothetical protein BST85_04000 [Aureitalea marina]
MDELLTKASLVTTYLSPVLAVLFLLKWKENGVVYRWFTMYLVAIGVIQLAQDLVIRFSPDEYNLFLFKYYLIFEFITLSFFYRSMLKSKWINWVIIGILLIITVQYIYYPEYLEIYNPLGIWLTHCALVALAINHLYRTLSDPLPFTLISAGLVVYLMGSAVVFSAGNIFQDVSIPRSVVSFLSRINSLLYLGLQILIIFEWMTKYSGARALSLRR